MALLKRKKQKTTGSETFITDNAPELCTRKLMILKRNQIITKMNP